MIIDSLEQAEIYGNIHPLFQKAFQHLRSLDLQKIPAGRYELEGERLFYFVTDEEGLTREASVARFECHNAYIDIQLCITGGETYGWKARKDCIRQKEDYLGRPDYFLFEDEPDMYFRLDSGQFAIFFPGDVHAPMIGERRIKKVLMKVKL